MNRNVIKESWKKTGLIYFYLVKGFIYKGNISLNWLSISEKNIFIKIHMSLTYILLPIILLYTYMCVFVSVGEGECIKPSTAKSKTLMSLIFVTKVILYPRMCHVHLKLKSQFYKILILKVGPYKDLSACKKRIFFWWYRVITCHWMQNIE